MSNDQEVLSRLSVADSTFCCLKNMDLDRLATHDPNQLFSVLPSLSKLLLNPYFTRRKQVLELLYYQPRTDDMIKLLQSKPLEPPDLVHVPDDKKPHDVIFESGSPRDRLKVVAIEYLKILDSTRQAKHQGNNNIKIQKSWLFDNSLYAEDAAMCLYALLNKPTNIVPLNLLDMCDALLQLKHGPSYIVYLVGNMPERFHEVCHSLISTIDKSEEAVEQRSRTVRMLCQADPKSRFRVERLAIQEMMPSLAIMLTVDRLQNKLDFDGYESAIAFVTGLLLDDNTRIWFSQYLKAAQSNQLTILSKYRESMLMFLDKLQSDDEEPLDKQVLIKIIATLRYFCALRGIGMLKLESEESEALLRLITLKPPASEMSVIFATIGVCTLLVCSSMVNNPKDEKRAADWLKWLIRDSGYNDSSYSGHGRCSISELLLLIAIHFQNNQTNQVADLVCATLEMRLQIKASVSKCKSLFVHEVFNDQMITEHAVKVPVTNSLDDTLTEFLPIHCIHQLLESRSFSKHQVPIQSWIYRQICEARKPIHHMLPKLIDAYVNSIVVSTSVHGPCGTNQPIQSDDIAYVFKTSLYGSNDPAESIRSEEITRPTQKKKKRGKKEKSIGPVETSDNLDGNIDDNAVNVVDYEVAQVLLLYYMALYDDVRLKKGCDLGPAERTNLIKYSPELMMEVPVFYLTQLVRDNQDMFGTIWPYLLKVIASQYPHLCSIQHWQHRSITNLPRHEIWTFVDTFMNQWANIMNLDDNLTRSITRQWWKLNTIFPRRLWVMTLNSLQNKSSNNGSCSYSWDDFTSDPLIVLRCDDRVFRQPLVLNIVLHVLSGFLAATKRCLQDQIYEQSTRQRDNRNLEELRATLVLAQTSAAIQILLESCIPDDKEREIIYKKEVDGELEDEEQRILDKFNSSVDCICEYLHQIFIADTNLAKLVHFQTYPSELLATTSNKIPSMHICLDFIPELLGQPELTRQVFVIELTSYLCQKYAITKSLNMAKLCFNVSYTLLQLLPSDKRAIFFIPVLPALLRISKVFPILREDSKIILDQINQITGAHMASTSSRLSLRSSQPFEGLDKMNWLQIEKLMTSLSLNEALFLCIQKCMLDICDISRK